MRLRCSKAAPGAPDTRHARSSGIPDEVVNSGLRSGDFLRVRSNNTLSGKSSQDPSIFQELVTIFSSTISCLWVQDDTAKDDSIFFEGRLTPSFSKTYRDGKDNMIFMWHHG